MALQNPKNVSRILKQGSIKESTRFGPLGPMVRILYKTTTKIIGLYKVTITVF